MGSFYVNFCVSGIESSELASWLKKFSKHAFVGPKVGEWICFVEKSLDDQDPEFIQAMGAALTRDSFRVAVSALNHDDDILQVGVYLRGVREGSYDSCPGYFLSDPTEEQVRPNLTSPSTFASLGENTDIAEVKAVLTEFGIYKEAWAIHAELVKLLGLPVYSVGAGYRNVSQGDARDDWTEIIAQ